MKVYQYTGCHPVQKSDENPWIQPSDFLLEGNEQFDMVVPVRCFTAGREPFEHVDEVQDVDVIKDFSELREAARRIRDFIKLGNYASLNWVKPSIDNL